MSEPKGPRLDIPKELEEELADDGETFEGQDSHEFEAELEARDGAGAAADLSSEPGGSALVEELRKEIAELKDRHLRAVAEHQNQRRRMLKEQQDAINFANENLVKDLLGTVDNLERALSHAQTGEGGTGTDLQNLLEGVQLTLRSLMNVLERSGVEVVDAADTKFDPKHHEAMRQVVTPDFEPGSVVEVYQKGYLLKGRLLRPALVAVAAPGSGESGAES